MMRNQTSSTVKREHTSPVEKRLEHERNSRLFTDKEKMDKERIDKENMDTEVDAMKSNMESAASRKDDADEVADEDARYEERMSRLS